MIILGNANSYKAFSFLTKMALLAYTYDNTVRVCCDFSSDVISGEIISLCLYGDNVQCTRQCTNMNTPS